MMNTHCSQKKNTIWQHSTFDSIVKQATFDSIVKQATFDSIVKPATFIDNQSEFCLYYARVQCYQWYLLRPVFSVIFSANLQFWVIVLLKRPILIVKMSPLQALYALVVCARLKAKETILIHSAGNTVGQAAINLALNFNCHIFVSVSSIDEKLFIKENFPFVSKIAEICYAWNGKLKTKAISIRLDLRAIRTRYDFCIMPAKTLL